MFLYCEGSYAAGGRSFSVDRKGGAYGDRDIQRGRRSALCLLGGIDHDAAQNLRIQLDDALLTRTPRTLVLDLGGVGFMDSSGVGLILGRQRCARSLGGTLRIQHAPEQLRRVLQLAGIACADEPGREGQEE